MREEEINVIVEMYLESTDEKEIIDALAIEFGTSAMEIRQTLQAKKVYKEKVGKTQKEAYANALYCVTGIPEKEFMKLSIKAGKQLMEFIKQGS